MDYLNCDEVALRYGVKIVTVWGWIRKKKLPAMKIGKNYRISTVDLEQFEENCRTVKKGGQAHGADDL